MKGPLLLFGFLELLVKNLLLLSGNILSMKNKLILSNNKHTSWWTDIIREIRILCMCRGDSVFEPNPIKYVRKYSGLDLNWQPAGKKIYPDSLRTNFQDEKLDKNCFWPIRVCAKILLLMISGGIEVNYFA